MPASDGAFLISVPPSGFSREIKNAEELCSSADFRHPEIILPDFSFSLLRKDRRSKV